MKMIKILFVSLLLLASNSIFAQREFVIDIWQGNPEVKSSDVADTAKIYVFLPENKKASGRAILICPGGGYSMLAMENEGTDWAPYFNRLGIAAIVLKYRMPHGKKEVPISDAEQAMRLIREHAKEWNIDPDDVGIMGSSAGGHLASTLATHSEGDALPNFQLLFYPRIILDSTIEQSSSHDNLLGKDAKRSDELLYSNNLQVSRTTPRALILFSNDDDDVPTTDGTSYYEALYHHDIPASIMIYPSGGHGFGMNPKYPYHLEMLVNVHSWLNSF